MSPKKKGARNRPAPAPRKSAGSRPRQAGGTPRQAAHGTHRDSAAPAATSIYTPGGSAFRHWLEGQSAPALLILTRGLPDGSRRPRPAMTFGPLILLVLGFVLPVLAGIVALVLFLLYTVWLAYLSWPRTDRRARLIRVAMVLLVIGLMVLRIVRG